MSEIKITPTTGVIGSHHLEGPVVPEGYDLTNITVNGKIACWNGHEIELVTPSSVLVSSRTGRLQISLVYPHLYELRMLVHYPIDPRMTEVDVRRATIRYPNEDNSGWLFAHCDADWMLDHERHLTSSVSDAFDEEDRKLHKALMTANHNLIISNTIENRTAFLNARQVHDNFSVFRQETKNAIIAEANTRHIGYYHQNPHEAHIHVPLERAIEATIRSWSQNTARFSAWMQIRSAVEATLGAVRNRHLYETRWDMEARLERERIAAQATSGVDPVGGYEYCYTLKANSDPITCLLYTSPSPRDS